MSPRTMRALQEAYSRHGTYGIFLSRFLPGLRAGVTPFAGVVGITAARALIPSAAASALWYAFLVAAGAALGQNFEAAVALINRVNRVLVLVTVVLVTLAAFWLWRHYRQRGEG
jgi:membrane protein DedA with SNARE-associated domain